MFAAKVILIHICKFNIIIRNIVIFVDINILQFTPKCTFVVNEVNNTYEGFYINFLFF